MATPIDYLGAQATVNPLQQFGTGFQLGATIRQTREQQEAAEKAKQAQEQYAADLRTALSNPTASAFAALSAKYPTQREAFKQSWDMLSKEQQDSDFIAGAQVYNAVSSGNTDAAKNLLDQKIVALENSGKDPTKLQAIRTALDQDPQVVQAQLGLVLSSLDPERWSKMATEVRAAQKAPAELSEAQAKAHKAAVDAKFAESNAALDLEKKGWDITKVQEDIKIAKRNAAIAAANNAIAKETNDLRRSELRLKVRDMEQARDNAVREKAAEVSTAYSGIDNSLNTIDRVLKNPELDNVLGSLEGKDFYPNNLVAMLRPGADSDVRADAIAGIETITSQAFLNNLMEAKAKGATFGALTEREGDRLVNYVTNLSRKQSEGQFRQNLIEAQRLLLKSRKTIAEKSGIPETVPDTPEATAQSSAGKSTDDILRELGVQ